MSSGDRSGGPRTGVPEPIGRSVERRDGQGKVTGAALYTADLRVPGMRIARVLRSPHPHARIGTIDSRRAAAVPGVRAIVTAADLVRWKPTFGHFVTDQPILARGRAIFAGEPVAAVVADDEFAASEALALIDVQYEPLAFVTDAVEALRPDAPVLHEGPLELLATHGRAGEQLPRTHPNLCDGTRQAWGDAEAALASAHLVIEGEYRYPMTYAYAMEPYAAIAAYEQGQLTVWSSAQHPYVVRQDLARLFGLPLSRVRLRVPYVGGGYGSKSFSKIEPLTAALAIHTGAAVKLVLTVEEAILTTRGDSAYVRLRSGFDKEGRVVARAARIWMNSGAYAGSSPGVARAAAVRLGGPYRTPALDVEAYSVYTNTAPASSFRGFGAPLGVVAAEQQMDEAATRLGLDPIEIRERNLLERGERVWPGARPLDADLRADLQLVRRALDWDAPPAAGRGRGVALSASDAGFVPISTSIVRVHADGSVSLLTGSIELGQGSDTVLAQIVAAEMGVALEQVHVVSGDTSTAPFESSTGASRTTTLGGRAIQAACADARAQLAAFASEAFGVPPEALEEVRGGLRVGETMHDWGAIVRAWFGGSSGEVIGRGYIRRSGEFSAMPPFWEIGCVGVEVSVDRATGRLRVERLVTVGDVGQAINPQLVEGQDVGAAMMGLGAATTEELRYEGGHLLNGNLLDYRVPRTTDLPEVTTLLAERGDGIGPYGAKGGGEGSLNPIAAAVANALFRAAGVRLVEVPLAPERVWRALSDDAARRTAAR